VDSSLELAFGEILRKLDELDAQMEQRFSRKLARLERRGAVVEPRVGGIEQSGATQLVVADIWGGLFDEIPAFAYEPVPAPDAAATEYTSTMDEASGGLGGSSPPYCC
jgi:hypothetical protein